MNIALSNTVIYIENEKGYTIALKVTDMNLSNENGGNDISPKSKMEKSVSFEKKEKPKEIPKEVPKEFSKDEKIRKMATLQDVLIDIVTPGKNTEKNIEKKILAGKKYSCSK